MSRGPSVIQPNGEYQSANDDARAPTEAKMDNAANRSFRLCLGANRAAIPVTRRSDQIGQKPNTPELGEMN